MICTEPTITSTALSADTDGGAITIKGTSFVPSGVDAGTSPSPPKKIEKRGRSGVGGEVGEALTFFMRLGSESNVTVDGKSCSSPTWQDDKTIICNVGAGLGKNKPVVVTIGGQASDSHNIFSYNGIFFFFSFLFQLFSLFLLPSSSLLPSLSPLSASPYLCRLVRSQCHFCGAKPLQHKGRSECRNSWKQLWIRKSPSQSILPPLRVHKCALYVK